MGTFGYGAAGAGPHAVTSANGNTFTYDANGNILTRSDGFEANWTGFDKPLWMEKNGEGSGFHYNLKRQRVVQHTFSSVPEGPNPTFTKKKLYIGGGMEVDYIDNAGTMELDRVRLYVNTPAGRSGAVEVDADFVGGATHRRLVYHQDHLGSIDVITEFDGGGVAQDWATPNTRDARYSYDAWGERRDPLTWQGQPTPATTHGGDDDLTPRGFTDHEMLDGLDLVHMNGRIYDPLLGRFLSADAIIDGPFNLQGYNRYSYVKNNPLSFTDPSGYSGIGAQFAYSNGAIERRTFALTKTFGTEKGEAIARDWSNKEATGSIAGAAAVGAVAAGIYVGPAVLIKEAGSEVFDTAVESATGVPMATSIHGLAKDAVQYGLKRLGKEGAEAAAETVTKQADSVAGAAPNTSKVAAESPTTPAPSETGQLSPTNYPNPDPPMSAAPARHTPTSEGEVVRMREGKGPTTKATHGTENIEAHHRQQVPTSEGGVIDELTQSTHRGPGSHSRHDKPSQLTPAQRAREIREHYKERGSEYILPGEGI